MYDTGPGVDYKQVSLIKQLTALTGTQSKAVAGAAKVYVSVRMIRDLELEAFERHYGIELQLVHRGAAKS